MAADFSTVVDAVLSHNMSDATRDKARLDQATSHNQKLVGRLDALSEKIDEGNERVADAFESNTEVQSEMLQNTDPDSAKNQEQINEENKRQEGLVGALQGVGDRITDLGKQAKDFAGETPLAIQALLAGAGFFALAKLLQSDTAKGVFTTIIQALIKFGKDIKELLNGTKGFIQVIFDNFLTILGIITAIKPKLVFNLLKKGIMKLAGYFDKAVEFFQDNDVKKMVGDKAKEIFGNLKNGIKGLGEGLKNFGKRLSTGIENLKKGSADKALKGMFDKLRVGFKSAGDSVAGFMNKAGSKIKGGFSSLDKFMSGGIKPMLAKAKVGMIGFFASMKSVIIGAFATLKGMLLANPLTAILVAVGAALAIIGSYFGFFDPLIDGIMNIFKKIKGFFVGIYNAFAESAIGRFLGLNPITDDEVVPGEGEPPDGTEGAGGNTAGGADSVMEDSPATQEKEMTQKEMVANALNKLAGQGDKPTVISNVTNAPNQSQSVTNTQNTAIVDRDFLIKSLTSMA